MHINPPEFCRESLSCPPRVYLSSRVFIREQAHGYSRCPLSHNPARLFALSQPRVSQPRPREPAGHILCPPDDPLACLCGSCIPSLSLSSTTRCAWLVPAISCPAVAWPPAGPLVLALENGVRNQDLGAGVLGKQSVTRGVSQLTARKLRVCWAELLPAITAVCTELNLSARCVSSSHPPPHGSFEHLACPSLSPRQRHASAPTQLPGRFHRQRAAPAIRAVSLQPQKQPHGPENGLPRRHPSRLISQPQSCELSRCCLHSKLALSQSARHPGILLTSQVLFAYRKAHCSCRKVMWVWTSVVSGTRQVSCPKNLPSPLLAPHWNPSCLPSPD